MVLTHLVAERCQSCALLMIWLCASTAGCEPSPDASVPVNARFVELYSLASVADAKHTIAVTDAHQDLWYRATEPGLNLSHLRLGETYTYECADGTYTVVFEVQTTHRGRLYKWTEERIGKNVGWMIDGRLAHVAEVKLAMSSRIGIDGFAAREHAERLVRAVDRGGIWPLEP